MKLFDGRTFIGAVEDVDLRSDLATIRIPCVSYAQSQHLLFVHVLKSPFSISLRGNCVVEKLVWKKFDSWSMRLECEADPLTTI